MYLVPELKLQEHLKKWAYTCIWLIIPISLLVLIRSQFNFNRSKNKITESYLPVSLKFFKLLSLMDLQQLLQSRLITVITKSNS